MTIVEAGPPAGKSTPDRVWRYMSFGRFVYLLKTKSLWMSRVDQLDDPWEMAISEDEIIGLMGKPSPLDTTSPVKFREHQLLHARRARQWFFVNCWTASPSESWAMWSVYCKANEGIAIQTTLDRLLESVASREHNSPQLKAVDYAPFNFRGRPLGSWHLVTRKRPEFAFEREYRIIYHVVPGEPFLDSVNPPSTHERGFSLRWDPEETIERVLIHPAADSSFRIAVEAVISQFAPKLAGLVAPSSMAAPPQWY